MHEVLQIIFYTRYEWIGILYDNSLSLLFYYNDKSLKIITSFGLNHKLYGGDWNA